MATDIRVPALGESVTEATIGQWFKKVGDTIAVDEPVVELETDKVTIEVPAPAAGVLEAISANPGDTVSVGSLIGAIGSGAVVTPKPAAAAPAPAPAPAAAPAAPVPPPAPAAQKLMSENGLGAGDVNGSGRRGQVLKEDVLASLNRPSVTGGSAAIARPAVAEAPKVAAPAAAPVAAPAPIPARPAPIPPPMAACRSSACGELASE